MRSSSEAESILVRFSVETSANRTADISTRAGRVLGDRITRIIAFGEWAPDHALASNHLDVANADALTRLRDAVSIAELLLSVESTATVRAWFVGENPMLGDRAPAIVIAEDVDKVRRAARDLVAHG